MNKPRQLTFPWEKIFKSSLDGFYCDKLNKTLLDELMEISDEDIFIYASKNTGKTYLLQALSNYYSEKNLSSLYIPLKEVKKYDTSIIEGISQMDVVLMDGLDEIIGDDKWEISIFNLINESIPSGCRLIFSMSIDKKINKFNLPDLDSRIRKLHSKELHPVQDQNLKDALLQIAQFRLINLGERELNYLLGYTKRNLSDLVSILERLDSLSMELKRKITIPLIKDLL